MQVALLLLLAAGQRQDLRVAGVGRGVAERQRRDRAGAEDLVHQPELDLAEPLAAQLGIEVRRPQPTLANLLGERRDGALEPVVAELVDQRLKWPDALAHELAHPVELLLKLGVCGEIPGHRWLRRGAYSVPSSDRLPRAAREVGLPFAHGSRSGGPYAAAASGSPDVHGRFLPAPGGRELAHAHRRRADLRGPAPGVRRLSQPHSRAPAPGTALPPAPGNAAAGDRASSMGRRSDLQP